MKNYQLVLILFLCINSLYTSPQSINTISHITEVNTHSNSLHTTSQRLQSNAQPVLSTERTNTKENASPSTSTTLDATNALTISANITTNQILKSNYTILISFTQPVPHIRYRLSTAVGLTNVSGNFTSFKFVIPNFRQQTEISMNLFVGAYDANNVSMGTNTFYFYLDDQWVFISSINPQGKLLPNTVMSIVYDLSPLGVNWRWDKDNIITTSYSSAPIITAPSIDGNYRLVLLITNPGGIEQTPLDYYYIIDGTAPPLTILTNITRPISSGSQILFQNTTDAGLDKNYFNFTWVGSGVYTTSFPIVKAPSGTYVLMASVHDELGNTRSANYTIKAKIGILNLYPNVAGRPGVPMNISLSENPFYANYSFYYSNNTLYSTSPTVPNLPNFIGSYIFKIKLQDVLGNWLNTTYNIQVDNTPPVFISANPVNNSIVYNSITITLTFGETPATIIYHFDSSANSSVLPIMLPNSAGIHNLTVYASDIALNWVQVNLSYTRFYRPALSIANNSIVFNNFTLTASINFPVNTTLIHWDNNPANQTFADYNKTSGLRKLNLTLVYNNIVSSNVYFYIINVTILSFHIGKRVQGNLPINPTFSESNVKFSWKYNNDLTWKFTQMVTNNTEGTNTLHVRMNSADLKYTFDQTYTYVTDNTPPQILNINPFTTLTNFTTLRSGGQVVIEFTDKACTSYCYSSMQYHYNQQTPVSIDLSMNSSVILYVPLGTIPVVSSGTIVNLTVSIKDVAQNIQAVTYSYRIDNTAPILNWSNVANGSSVFIPWTLHFNFSENSLMQVNYTFKDHQNKMYSTINSYSGQNITIVNVIFGNQSVKMNCSVSDYYGNSRRYVFNFSTIDPALVLFTNATLSDLKESNLIFFFSNKLLYSQNITFITADNNKTLPNLNTTIPLLDVNYEGFMNITARATDFQGDSFSIHISFIIDNKAPIPVVSGYKIQTTGSTTVTVYGVLSSQNITRVLVPSVLSIIIYDAHTITVNASISDNSVNGYSQTYYFTNKSFLISVPQLINNIGFSLNLVVRDSFGNSKSYYFDMESYILPSPVEKTQSDEVLPIIGLSAISIAGISAIFYGNKKFNILDKLKPKKKE